MNQKNNEPCCANCRKSILSPEGQLKCIKDPPDFIMALPLQRSPIALKPGQKPEGFNLIFMQPIVSNNGLCIDGYEPAE